MGRSQSVPQTKGEYIFDGIHCDSSLIIGWASAVHISRGYMQIDNKQLGTASAGDPVNALGKADNITLSLGDSGIAILSFDLPIVNSAGPDIAVFENSFDGSFLELAFVEVSTDSLHWVRFPSVSNTPYDQQIGTFETINPTDLHNLAGKYKALTGTPFDLEELKDSIMIDINEINFVRIIDIIGSVNPDYASYDSDGNIINDPWPTPFESSGFDLDAVAILGGISSLAAVRETVMKIYPNPVNEIMMISGLSVNDARYIIWDSSGNARMNGLVDDSVNEINTSGLQAGIYIIAIYSDSEIISRKFIKSW